MSKDFSKYQRLIDQFSGQVLNSEFEARYAVATKKMPKTERFLLKMELKRLASPCTRLVDLRGHVDGECRSFEHDNRIHYLDDIAIKVFQESTNNYGSYTFGVYEAVMNTENNFRVIYKKEKNLSRTDSASTPVAKVVGKTQYHAKRYNFGPYYNRCEERMNFAIAIQVYFENHSKAIEATSSDVSTNGCKFRFNSLESIAINQIIDIRFSGLEGEFQFGKDDKFSYQIKNIQVLDNIQLIGVERVYTLDEKRDGFKQFLTGFIQGNKRRYKINLDNTITALQSRSFEQFILPKSNELPIFICDNKEVIKPRYALTCHNNQKVFEYWQDEKRHSHLHCLITTTRLMRLKKAKILGKSLIVYSFKHYSKGKSYFYTVDDVQLQGDDLFKQQFLGFAAAKASFAITQLSLLDFDKEKAESPLTLANVLAKKDQYLNLPCPKQVKVLLSQLNSIVVAHQIDDENITQFYQALPYENINTAKLKQFGHKRELVEQTIDNIGINSNDHRQESRFNYKTPIVVTIDNNTWHGKSHDFSANGIKVEFDQPVALKQGVVIYVSFPELQKITSAFELKSLPYEVMRVSNDNALVNLRAHVEKHQHIGRSFFKALINKNKSKLSTNDRATSAPGLAKALRNIYSASSDSLALIIQTSGSRYKIEAITTNQDNSKLLNYCQHLSDRKQYYNLYPLLNNQQATSLMNNTLKRIKPGDAPISDVLYLSFNLDKESVEQAVTSKLDSELQSEKLKKMFISKAIKRGHFLCLQVKLSRAEEPDMELLNPELSYISSYAIHRGKQIEQDIWSVAGIVQVFDITQETLIRHHLS